MTDIKDATAAELAEMLRNARRSPHLTGWLSMLDEATLAFGDLSPELGSAQQEFAQARHAHHRSCSTATGGYSDEKWQTAMESADHLAGLLDALGDRRIGRCQRPAGWGVCNLPVDETGACRYPDHED